MPFGEDIVPKCSRCGVVKKARDLERRRRLLNDIRHSVFLVVYHGEKLGGNVEYKNKKRGLGDERRKKAE